MSQFKADLRAIVLRAADNIVGFKFLALTLASVFFATGKLSDTLWVEVVFVVCGLRAATDISQVIADSKKPQVTNVTNQVETVVKIPKDRIPEGVE